MANSDFLIEEKDLPENLETIHPATVRNSPPGASNFDRYAGGSLPPVLGLQTDLVQTNVKGSVPVYRLMPAPVSGSAQAGSAAQSNLLKNPAFVTNQQQTQQNTQNIQLATNPPGYVTGLSVAKAVAKDNTGTLVQVVEVSFTPPTPNANLGTFQQVDIFATGYQGSAQPTLIGSGLTSPVFLEMSITGETVTLTAQSVSSTGIYSVFNTAPTISVTLNGVTTAPAAPSIAVGLASTTTGYSFAFNFDTGLGSDTIRNYNIYRNTTNSTSGAVILTSIPQPQNASGTYTFSDTVPYGAQFFYWVSAVNTTGLESALKSAGSSTNTTSGIGIPSASKNAVANPGFELNSLTNTPLNSFASPGRTIGQSVGDQWTVREQATISSSVVWKPALEQEGTAHQGQNNALFELATGVTIPNDSVFRGVRVVTSQIPVYFGQTVSLSGYLSFSATLPAGVTIRQRVGILWYDATGAQVQEDFPTDIGAPSGGYVQSSASYSVPTNAAYLSVQIAAFIVNSGVSPQTTGVGFTSDLRYDDISLVVTSDLDTDVQDGIIYGRRTLNVGDVVIQNGNFEASGTILPPPGYVNYSNTPTLSYDTATPFAGTRSLVITSPAGGGGGVAPIGAVYCLPGDTFYASAYAKRISGAGAASVSISFRAANGAGVGGADVTTTSSSFTFLQNTQTAPAGTVYATFEIYATAASTTVEFDNHNVVFVSNMDTDVQDGSTFARVLATALSSNAVDLSKSGVLPNGSTPLTANNGFTYTSTTSSVNLAWSGQAVYKSNGVVASVGSGSQNVTGLASATTYYAFPYFDEPSQTLKFCQNSDVTFPSFSGVTFTAASSQEITTTTAAALGASFSVEFLVKTAAGYAGNGGICKALAQTGTITSINTVYTIGFDGAGHIQCSFRDTGGTLQNLTSTIKVNDGNYHHIVHSVTGSSVNNLYIDGVQAATASLSTSPSATATDFWRIAKDSGNIFFGGTLSEIAIYGSALTAIQAAGHYAATTISQSQYESTVSSDAPTIQWKLTGNSQTFSDTGSIGSNTGHGVNTPALQQTTPFFSAVGSPQIMWTTRNLLVAQAQFLQSRVPLTSGGMAVATTAAGTGSGGTGGSTGGSGSGCFSGNTLVKTPNGGVRIDCLQPGDVIVSKNANRRIFAVLRHDAEPRVMFDMGNGELVTGKHIVSADGAWRPASAVFATSSLVSYEDEVFNLTVQADSFDDHSFQLANGVLAHNGKVV